jgi:hypothetical protein
MRVLFFRAAYQGLRVISLAAMALTSIYICSIQVLEDHNGR